MDTEGLVKQARSGDDDAFYELIHRQKEMLYRTAYAYVKNRDDALDIVGDTVYKAYRSFGKLRDPALFKTWLTRILINCSLDHIKKHGRVIVMEESEMPSRPLQVNRSPENIDIYRAMDALDDKCRTVIILKYFQDLTITQISYVMQCPQGTIKTYLHRALKNLRLELKEDWLNA